METIKMEPMQDSAQVLITVDYHKDRITVQQKMTNSQDYWTEACTILGVGKTDGKPLYLVAALRTQRSTITIEAHNTESQVVTEEQLRQNVGEPPENLYPRETAAAVKKKRLNPGKRAKLKIEAQKAADEEVQDLLAAGVITESKKYTVHCAHGMFLRIVQ